MALTPAELAFAEAAILEGLPPAKALYALKVKESGEKKPLPNIFLDLRLLGADEAKRLWRLADLGIKAAPGSAFSFSAGAMMGFWELREQRVTHLAGDHWLANRGKDAGLLRLVPPGLHADEGRAQRLADRANAGVDAPDPSILKVDDAGEEFNWLYVGTVGFDGDSLAARTQKGPLAESDAIEVAGSIGAALRVAHGFGVVHGGLNPLAIVFGKDGVPRLTDFGVGSVFFDGPTAGMKPGSRLGLLLYAAPELIHGSGETGLDARADLFALGALVYEAVASVRPRDPRAGPEEPWVTAPPVSAGFKEVLRRLLAHDVEDRYASADAFLVDLEAVASGSMPGPLAPAGPPLLVAQRPSSAKPLAVVTAELLKGGESQVALAPEVVRPGAKTQRAFRAPRDPDEPSDPAGELLPQSDATAGSVAAADAKAASDAEAPYFNVGQAPAPEAAEPGETAPTPVADGGEPEAEETASSDEAVAESGDETDSGEDELGEAPSDEVPVPGAAAKAVKPEKKKKKGKKKLKGHALREVTSGAVSGKKERGVIPLVLSFVVVVGSWFGASAATTSDGVMLAKIELGRGSYFLTHERDYRKTGDRIELARELAKLASPEASAAVLAEALALEDELRRTCVREYLAERAKTKTSQGGDLATVSDRCLEPVHLTCLHALDQCLAESTRDGKVWQGVGQELLLEGFSKDALVALEQAASLDPSLTRERDITRTAAKLGAFLPSGTYASGKLKVEHPLYLGATEVTRADYARWLTDSQKGTAPHGSCHAKEPQGKSHAPDGWDPALALATNDQRPATGVDFFDAYSYARATGTRLPTVAELRAAAQGRFARARPWGEGAFEPSLANAANAHGLLLPVGSFPGGASPQGAFDLLGNAEEWAALETQDAAEAPVLGGDFETPAEKLSLDEPTPTKTDARSPKRGFRCVLDLKEPPKGS
ncbi:SUMF1/EgtB/PvdO family nonheme iron enzyme [bacterium]|nr:SUMF1/EgtB/PvdO family nonheme iron enzyme [bacterium]